MSSPEPQDDHALAGRLIERLLVDPVFRAEFRRDPVGACVVAGLPGLAGELGGGVGSGMETLELRESRSSLAGVVMAAAVEGLSVAEAQAFVEHGAKGLHGLRVPGRLGHGVRVPPGVGKVQGLEHKVVGRAEGRLRAVERAAGAGSGRGSAGSRWVGGSGSSAGGASAGGASAGSAGRAAGGWVFGGGAGGWRVGGGCGVGGCVGGGSCGGGCGVWAGSGSGSGAVGSSAGGRRRVGGRWRRRMRRGRVGRVRRRWCQRLRRRVVLPVVVGVVRLRGRGCRGRMRRGRVGLRRVGLVVWWVRCRRVLVGRVWLVRWWVLVVVWVRWGCRGCWRRRGCRRRRRRGRFWRRGVWIRGWCRCWIRCWRIIRWGWRMWWRRVRRCMCRRWTSCRWMGSRWVRIISRRGIW